MQNGDTIISGVFGQSSMDRNSQREKSFVQRTLRNLLSSTEVELNDTDINFYCYQDNSDHHEPLPNFGESTQVPVRHNSNGDHSQWLNEDEVHLDS